MKKILKSIAKLSVKSFWALGLASLILAMNFMLPQSSYGATAVKQGAEEVIQPFEMTNPAATRSEAYDEVAKLNKDPKALIAAENKEEQAEERAYKEEVKAAESIDK